MSRTLQISSGAETLQADLYGELPVQRAVVLVHGRDWDGSGWRDIAPRFVARGVAAVALNLRGYDGSSGRTEDYVPPAPWTPVIDLAATKALLREHGVREIALVGASLGGHAVLASGMDGDAECVVALSAPVTPTPDELMRRVRGRTLLVCADLDTLGAAPNVLRAFAAIAGPKALLMFGGREHSR
ncbi:MAG: alpha/beta fold hydrolase, partial [Chloroflexota bacterium]